MKIQTRTPLWSGAACQGCGATKAVKFFSFSAGPHEGAPGNMHIYCRACAQEIGEHLCCAWGCAEVPTWLKMMDKLSRKEGVEE